MPTKKKPGRMLRRNPVDASGYQNTDARDEQRREREQSRRFVCFFDGKRSRPVAPLGMHVRTLAHSSAEKPRWQKIIEHADSLADERGMSREEFYSMALIELIEKFENERLTEEYNKDYDDMDGDEDLLVLNHLVGHYDPRLADG